MDTPNAHTIHTLAAGTAVALVDEIIDAIPAFRSLDDGTMRASMIDLMEVYVKLGIYQVLFTLRATLDQIAKEGESGEGS